MTTRTNKGITLLLAILILSSVLSIALGILYVIFIEIKINQTARESYKAFYAAETGMECARYYHTRAHPTKADEKSFWDPEKPCFGNDVGACGGGIVEGGVSNNADIYCAGVRVTDFKTINPGCGSESTEPSQSDCIAGGGIVRDYEFDIRDPSSLPTKPVGIFTHVKVHSVFLLGENGPGTKVVIMSQGKNDESSSAVNRSLESCASRPVYCPAGAQP